MVRTCRLTALAVVAVLLAASSAPLAAALSSNGATRQLEQKTALQILRISLDKKGVLDWDSSVDVCKWYGVTCDEDGSVIALQLPGIEMAGVLPTEDTLWAFLATLRVLDLSKNGLSGLFPDAMVNLVRLRYLDLSSNAFTGALPSGWGAMTQLVSLDLSTNALTGQLPSGWTSMTSLRYLDLSNNSFSGYIPSSWSTIGLTSLSLANNQALCISGNVLSPAPATYYSPCETSAPSTYVQPNVTLEAQLASVGQETDASAPSSSSSLAEPPLPQSSFEDLVAIAQAPLSDILDGSAARAAAGLADAPAPALAAPIPAPEIAAPVPTPTLSTPAPAPVLAAPAPAPVVATSVVITLSVTGATPESWSESIADKYNAAIASVLGSSASVIATEAAAPPAAGESQHRRLLADASADATLTTTVAASDADATAATLEKAAADGTLAAALSEMGLTYVDGTLAATTVSGTELIASTTTAVSGTSSTAVPAETGTSGGAIAGAVVGSIAGAVLVGCLAIYCYRRHAASQHESLGAEGTYSVPASAPIAGRVPQASVSIANPGYKAESRAMLEADTSASSLEDAPAPASASPARSPIRSSVAVDPRSPGSGRRLEPESA